MATRWSCSSRHADPVRAAGRAQRSFTPRRGWRVIHRAYSRLTRFRFPARLGVLGGRSRCPLNDGSLIRTAFPQDDQVAAPHPGPSIQARNNPRRAEDRAPPSRAPCGWREAPAVRIRSEAIPHHLHQAPGLRCRAISAGSPRRRRPYLNQTVSASHFPSSSIRVVRVRPFFILTLAVFFPPSSPISTES